MHETWLRESRVPLPALVMLETWLGKSEVKELFREANLFFCIELSGVYCQH